ncbi:MAG: hypothetical protein KGJ43_03240, partial [Acidobacteriota bacterium]|nr:hypothetical protein [Acidobacteriota bacterium]
MLLGGLPALAAASTVNIVGPGFYPTIQSAVNASEAGGWVLIEPGTYDEEVWIETPGLHVRGLNR